MPKRETQAVVEAFELMFPEAPNAQLARYVGRHVSTITRWRRYGEGGPTCEDMDRVDARLSEHIGACIQAQSRIRAARWRARLARPDRSEAPQAMAPKHPTRQPTPFTPAELAQIVRSGWNGGGKGV